MPLHDRYDTEMDAHHAVKQDLLVQVQVAEWRQQQAAATIVSLQQQVSRFVVVSPDGSPCAEVHFLCLCSWRPSKQPQPVTFNA